MRTSDCQPRAEVLHRERRASAKAALKLASQHALLLIVIGGAAVRFATLASQGFWYDEGMTVYAITLDPSAMLPGIIDTETSPPLYFIVAKGWQAVFGVGEVGLRSLSALAGTATIPVAYAAGRSLASRRIGLLAAALTATSPFMIWYSQEARPYALFTLLSALAFLFFVRAMRDAGSRWLWAWAICSILAFGTHYFGVLLTSVEGLWLLWQMRDRRAEVALAIGATAAAGLMLAPLALAQRERTRWIEGVPGGERVLQIPQHFVVGLNSPWEFLPPLAVGIVLVLAGFVIVRADRRTLSAAAMPAGLVAAVVAVPITAMLLDTDFLISRNLTGAWVPFAIALAALLSGPAFRGIGTIALAALCTLGLGLAIWNAATPAAGRPDWEPLVAALGPASTTRVIEHPRHFAWAMVPLVHDFADARHTQRGERIAVREIVVVEPRPTANYSIGPCWWVGFCGGRNLLGPLGELQFPVPPTFRLIAEGKASLFTYRSYRAPRPVSLPPDLSGGALIQPAP